MSSSLPLLKETPCKCSEENPKVLAYFRVTWKNGVTDIQIRKQLKKFRAIDHCCEHRTRDGIGISQLVGSFRDAYLLAMVYADSLAVMPPEGKKQGKVEYHGKGEYKEMRLW